MNNNRNKHLAQKWNNTEVDFPKNSCLHQLFEKNVQQQPGAPAVLFSKETITYAELNSMANQLAHYLRSLGVGLEIRVGICVERSVEMVVGILGVLKAGGAYVPLDPAYPKQRQAFMLRDSKVSVLVTQKKLVANLPENQVQIICLDEDWPKITEEAKDNPTTGVEPDNLAYVIYTSGSTGKPKGIALRHSGVVNNLYDLNQSFAIGTNDRVIAISSLSFDMCVYEVLGTLAAGGAIVMPLPSRLSDPAHWAELVVKHGVTVWNSAPQLLEMLVEYVKERTEFFPRSLRVVILGGDWVAVTLPGRLKAMAENVRVIVLGGATEASIHSIVFPVDKTDPDWRSIPYGRPMRNQKAFILDEDNELVAVGEPGELHLGGIGLARGYFDRPDLTAEKFIPNPYSNDPGERIYKTGDLARWLPDGNIELIGRIDHQVKIRGFRIELGEISSLLNEHTAVQDAVVLAREDEPGQKQLVAYVVPSPADKGTETDSENGHAQGQQISQWQDVYDNTYGKESELTFEPTLNFVGWISSFTGEAFSEPELRETLDCTVNRIMRLQPKHVLELGCGTGLVLFQVAPNVEKYDACDFSTVVIQDLQKQLQQAGSKLKSVSVQRRLADDFSGIEANSYDTVIINSVTQHFPGIDYLKKVLERVAKAVEPGGSIFIGDIRSLPHLEWFHTTIELNRSQPSQTLEQFQQQVQRGVRQEKELFIDPAFFASIKQHVPAINDVEIRLRKGVAHNEITKYHYDVVLHVGPQESGQTEIEWLDWRKLKINPDQVKIQLQNECPNFLGFRMVPNARLRPETKVAEFLEENEDSTLLDGVKQELDQTSADEFVDPEDFWSLAKDLPYSVEICWSGADEIGFFDVLLTRRETNNVEALAGSVAKFHCEQAVVKHLPEFGNQPLSINENRKLAPQLRSYLENRLPGYMVPSACVILDAFPLNPNGKIDRRSLPPPEHIRPELEVEFTPPQNPVEEVLAGIWSEALGLNRIGIHDNFFELGGHSLTATRIVSQIRETFQIAVPLRDLFENPTVAVLAESIVLAGKKAEFDILAMAQAVVELNQMTDEEVEAMLAVKNSLN